MFLGKDFSVSIFVGCGSSKLMGLNLPPSFFSSFCLPSYIVTLASVPPPHLSPSPPTPQFLRMNCIYELTHLSV